MYYVYIIKCQDNSLYTGITNEIVRRIKQHYYREKQSAKYTKCHQMTSLEALWQTTNKSQALKLEYQIKKLNKINKLKIIKSNENFILTMKDKIEIQNYFPVDKELINEIFLQAIN